MRGALSARRTRIHKLALCIVGACFFIISNAHAQVKFIENQGQWPAKALYKANLVNGDIWLTDSGLLFNLWDAGAAKKMHDRSLNNFTLNHHAFYLHFKGASMKNLVSAGERSTEYYNYYLGPDATKWKSGIYGWSELEVKDLYPGVDLRIFSQHGALKYNLICREPENLALVKLQYIGVDGLSLEGNHLDIKTSLGDFIDAMPLVVGQNPGKEDEPISALYKLEGNEIRFALQGEVARRYSTVIVDPVLVFSTYSGSTADNFGCTGTYDDLGFGYAGGTVFSSGFPISVGAFQTAFGGGVKEDLGYGDGRDVGILKFSPDGKTLFFCTYLGGNNNEQPHSMVTDPSDNLFVMGSTRSVNFPTTSGAYDQTQNGDYDFFVSKISPDGKSLMGSTFIGGTGMDAVGANRDVQAIDNFPLLYNYADEFRGEIITDGNNVFVAGVTYSNSFPKSFSSGTYKGNEDACIFSLNKNLTTLKWSQIVGSSGYDAFYGLALGKSNDVFAAGGSSGNIPAANPKWLTPFIGGIADGICARFDSATGAMKYGTYLGTGAYEQVYFVQTDNSGNPYFYGQTEGTFPIVNATFNQPGTGQFIVRMDPSLQSVTMSTTFGFNNNTPNISPSAFLVDKCERIFVSGWGGETNNYLLDFQTFDPKTHRNKGYTKGLPLTSDAVQKSTDGSDFYLAIFAKNMESLLYATYFGGVGNANKDADEHVDGGTSRFDKKGIIYQSVCAGCGKNGLFPTTPGAYSRTNNSFNCNNALFKIDFENLNKKPQITDQYMEVIATDAVDITAQAVDPDPADTLNVKWFLISKGGTTTTNQPTFTLTKTKNKATLHLTWQTDCNSWSTEPVIYKVMVYDNGCPNSDTTFAYIKILVKEPPKVIPPDAICVSFDRITGKLNIMWPATLQDMKFFDHLELMRKDPQGNVTKLFSIGNTANGMFSDLNAISPDVNDYCYWIDGYNICGTKVSAAMPFCTVNEIGNPITGVHIKYATVEMDRRVRIYWEESQEPDFKEYEVYRYPRGGTPGNIPIAYTTDTFFVDSSFDVDAFSYCYAIVVTDKCGHASSKSNEGCNVVIRGSATGKPYYFFDLDWQDYSRWERGVEGWTLERQYAQNPWTVVGNTANTRTYRDNNLDYDWGGYWYRVTAKEQLKGQARPAYESQSNWIYLIQPPELYVPSAFTVNQDNINEVWGTVPVFVRNYSMKVYNRWGQKIWESTAKKRQWDGIVDGVKAADGVYAWYVIFDGWDEKTYTMTGTVTVLH